MIPNEKEEKIKRKLLGIAITKVFNNQDPVITKGHLRWLVGAHHIKKSEMKGILNRLKDERIIEVYPSGSYKVRIVLSSEIMKRIYLTKVQSSGKI